MANLSELLFTAYQAHQLGNLPQAEADYQQLLAEHPEHWEALKLLGLLAIQTGRTDQVEPLFRQAQEILLRKSQFYNQLGTLFRERQQYEQAVFCYQQALLFTPTLTEAGFNLAALLQIQGKMDESLEFYQQALQQNPGNPQLLFCIGNVLQNSNRLPEAISYYQQALERQPNLGEAYYNLGLVYIHLQKLFVHLQILLNQ